MRCLQRIKLNSLQRIKLNKYVQYSTVVYLRLKN
jgi:hypothetical protein